MNQNSHIKLDSLIGYVKDDEGQKTSYIGIKIEGGSPEYNIGDQVWFNSNGKEMEIFDGIEKEDFEKIAKLFGPHKRAFKGAILRMGVEF